MGNKLSAFYYNRGLSLAREDRLSEAVHNLTKAAGYDTGNVNAWNLAGLCYYRLGKFATARYCWTQSLQARSEDNAAAGYLADLNNALVETAPFFSEAASLCGSGQYGQAAGLVKQELCGRLGTAAALLNYLGILYKLAGQTGPALRSWLTVLELDKANSDALGYLEETGRSPSGKLLQWLERQKVKWLRKPDPKAPELRRRVIFNRKKE